MYKLCCAIGLMMVLPVVADTEQLRDPTTPLGQILATKENTVVALNLNSVLISSQRKVAVINGQALRQGEEIKGSGFRVVSIKKNSVTVQSHNTTRLLSLVDSKVKK